MTPDSAEIPVTSSEGNPTPALEVTNVRKVFGGVVALADASLRAEQGEIHALLGGNGAGKSTLVNILAGVEVPDGGEVRLFGVEMSWPLSPAAVRNMGVSFIHQHLGLVDDMSVVENVALIAGYERGRVAIDWRATEAACTRALEQLHLDLDPRQEVGALPIAMKSLVAIARALALDCRLLVLDEPTASLPASEVEILLDVLRRLRSDGVAMVLISHRLDEVQAICDRVTVLRDGRVVLTAEAGTVSTSQLVEAIIGRAGAAQPRESVPLAVGTPMLEAKELRGDGVGPVSFAARRGEVLGLAGVVGAGPAAIGRLLLGREKPTSGSIELDGASYAPSGPEAAVARGIAFVPSDRGLEGAASHLTVRENLFLNPYSRATKRIRPAAERAAARELLEAFDVRPRDPEAEFSTLSGGNAQKVVLARCLARNPKLIVLDEPTLGVDAGSKPDIHTRLRRACVEGAAAILISSDFEEIEQVCDRVLVMSGGVVTQVLEGGDISARRIAEAAHLGLGGTEA